MCIQCGVFFLLPEFCALDLSVETLPNIQDINDSTTTGAVWWRPGIAVTTSVLLNGVFLFVVSMFYFSEEINAPPIRLDAVRTADEQTTFEVLPTMQAGGLNAATKPRHSITDTHINNQQVTISSTGNVALPSGLGGTGGGGSGPGSGIGTGMFTGSDNARSFAYVVDASGSMEGPRMQLVLQELSHSINSLEDGQQFFVVFFSDRTFSMMWPKVETRLVTANQMNRTRILQWAFTVEPDGGTEPDGALKIALGLRPDIVYFLTDGDIPNSTLRTVKRNRKGRTVVNTISVGRQTSETMKEIAVTSGGEFVAVR